MPDKYKLLEPLDKDHTTVSVTGTDLKYFNLIYTYALTFTIAFALVMIVIGGIQWTASSMSPSGKDEAKKRIMGAITGLILALFSWIILNTINPDLVSPKLILTPSSASSGGGTQQPTGGGGLTPTGGLSDTQARESLKGVATFDLANCNTPGVVSPCGNFEGVSTAVVNEIKGLRTACSGCELIARDATGPGHDANAGHYSGDKIDMAPTVSLVSFMRSNYKELTPGPNGWSRYQAPDGTVWVYEVYPQHGKDHLDGTVPHTSSGASGSY